MRISQKDAEEREAFMTALFQENEKLSGPKANAALRKKFGSAMRMARVYEIRDKVVEEKQKAAGVTAAGRKPPKGVTRAGRQLDNQGPFPQMIKVAPGEAEVISHSLQTLRAAGLTNLTVEAHKGEWAVINVA